MRTELFISRAKDAFQAAVREDGTTVEFRVESVNRRPRYGTVVKARVSRVVPAIQAAFVDLGMSRDAFLHASDLRLPGESAEALRAPIQDRLREGRELTVQINRESSTAKGDRVTCELAFAGRLLAIAPMRAGSAVSRRIIDPAERDRLAGIVEGFADGRESFVVRTAALGAGVAALRAEAARLRATWTCVRDRAEKANAPTVLYREPDLPIRLLRDAPAEQLERVVLDDEELLERVRSTVGQVDARLLSRIQMHRGERSMFETHGLDQDLDRALRPQVWLKSGGNLVIEPTEALVSIDVNTAKSIKGGCQETTSLKTNLEAVEAIARQLRLRDLGGIVVIDLVDMRVAENRNKVVDALDRALRADPARTKIVHLSEIGVLQLTRKRTRNGPATMLMRSCAACSGSGMIRGTPG